MSTTTTVDTGKATAYVFKTRPQFSDVEICTRPRDGHDTDERHYVDLEGKGVTAVTRLVESHAELRAFFDNIRVLAEFDHHGRLVRFLEADECDTDELEAAREKVAEIFEAIADFEGLEL